MRKFSSLPAPDRWSVLDEELPQIIAAHVKAAEVDPTEEIAVAEIAQRHRTTEAFMVKRLRDLGGQPYCLGAFYFIRRRSLVLALEAAETTATRPATRKRSKLKTKPKSAPTP
ncbi:hypothetical protein OKA05_08995 [Luteolibacter arcticus]|uniref:Uncharacterized protein n=1 Tax=Luteolibacter arcticus TaxID=1581411 RepID=A0ABT3GGF3_9BACT|nr:hypothetical protein [Luteolibacter arcticus]MCW1922688.1 hypothetical protein [Luteolibacter arcticus]